MSGANILEHITVPPEHEPWMELACLRLRGEAKGPEGSLSFPTRGIFYAGGTP